MPTALAITAKRRLILLLTFSLAVICNGVARADTPPNTLTEPERRSGWRLLFDGQSSDAFRGYRQTKVPAGWVVEEGTLVRKAAGAGDLVTKDTFEHFELLLDYRIAANGKPAGPAVSRHPHADGTVAQGRRGRAARPRLSSTVSGDR
jgi:hypothetical protein